MDQNCTTTTYAGQGCIGTAVSTHGTLPFTGFDAVAMVGLAVLIFALAIAMRAADTFRG